MCNCATVELFVPLLIDGVDVMLREYATMAAARAELRPGQSAKVEKNAIWQNTFPAKTNKILRIFVNIPTWSCFIPHEEKDPGSNFYCRSIFTTLLTPKPSFSSFTLNQ